MEAAESRRMEREYASQLLQALLRIAGELQSLAQGKELPPSLRPVLARHRSFLVGAIEALHEVLHRPAHEPINAMACVLTPILGSIFRADARLDALYFGASYTSTMCPRLDTDVEHWTSAEAVERWNRLPAGLAAEHPLYARPELRWRLECDPSAKDQLTLVAANLQAQQAEREALVASRRRAGEVAAARRAEEAERAKATRHAVLGLVLPLVDATLADTWQNQVLDAVAAEGVVRDWVAEQVRARGGPGTLLVATDRSVLKALDQRHRLHGDTLSAEEVTRVGVAAARRWHALAAAFGAVWPGVAGQRMTCELTRDFWRESGRETKWDGGRTFRAWTAGLVVTLGPLRFEWDVLLHTNLPT